MKKIIIIIICIFSLTGCFNYRELSDLGIITAIAIDKCDDNFDIMVQVVNPKKEQDASSAEEPKFITYKSSAKTIQEALRKIINNSPSKLYGSHMQLLIISEEVAKNNLDKMLDYFARDPEIRSEINIFISKNNNAKEQLTILTPLINLPSTKILNSLKSNIQYLGTSQNITLNDLLNKYLNPYTEITIPSLEIEGDINSGQKKENIDEGKTDTSIILSDIGIFKNNKLIGFINEQEALGLNFILNNIKGTIIKYSCGKDKYLVSEILKSKTKLKADLKNNTVYINIEGHSSISELSCDYNIRDTNNINKIADNINNTVKNIVLNSFNTIKNKYNTDIFGFQDLYYKTNPTYFKQHCSNWYTDIFPNLKINVTVNYKLYEKGSTLGGINNEKLQN